MRNVGYVVILLAISASIGCVSMCDSSLDCQYNAYGGVRDRIDRTNGRVASIFDPAAAAVAPPVVEEPLPDMPDRFDSDSDESNSPDAGEREEGEGLTEDLLKELRTDLPEVPNPDADDLDLGGSAGGNET